MSHSIWKHYDIVAMIFLQASLDNFLAPLSLSAVCREWREFALGTPSIWTLEGLHRIRASGLSDWVARASPGGIVLKVPAYAHRDWMSIAYTLTPRITRLSLRSAHGLAILQYPNLAYLHINDLDYVALYPNSQTFVDRVLATISPTTHPNLRVLLITTRLTHFDVPILPCPTVTELGIIGIRLDDWAPTLLAYSPRLVSLSVVLGSHDPGNAYTLVLPRLRCLRLGFGGTGLSLETPALRLLMTHISSMGQLVNPALTVGNVSSLKMSGEVTIPLRLFPLLVRLYVDSTPVREILATLLEDPLPCDRLEQIVLACPVAYEDATFMNRLESRRGVDVVYSMHRTVVGKWQAKALK